MIDAATYGAFVGACLVLVLVPGPDMAFLLTCSVARGHRAGILAVLGINAGAYLHLVASVLGLSAVLATSAAAFTAVKWAGAAYLIFLGLRALVSRGEALALDAGVQADACQRGRSPFWQGFWCDVLNPKVALFYLAFLPQFVDPEGPNRVATLLFLGVTLNVLALAINLVLVALGLRLAVQRNRVVHDPKLGLELP